MAVEEPSFRTEFRQGEFEVRDYPALVAAEVVVPGGQKAAVNRGFRLLAGYIFGGNAASRSIAMTAPVTQIEQGGGWLVRFTMPKAYELGALPRPRDPQIRLKALPPARLAVLRFSGLAEPTDVAAKTAELVAFVAARRLTAAGPAALAQYDPPWTPWFMRRNEVMIPLAP